LHLLWGWAQALALIFLNQFR